MNSLHVGFSKHVPLPKGGFLYIDDEVPEHPLGRVFDPTKDSFNPLRGITYKKARELADVLYAINPQGENTLTVRNGKRAFLRTFLASSWLDDLKTEAPVKRKWKGAPQEPDDEVSGMIADLLASPILRKVLTSKVTPFPFRKDAVILAKLDRKELGEFDALVLGLLLIGHYKGQVVIPDFGFYGRDAHVSRA